EATYGSIAVLLMIVATSLVTGALNVLVFPQTVLLGASGVVFMMILLASFTNFNKGEIPMTFILVMAIYLGKEVWSALASRDNISQFAHVIGGLAGSFFGFFKPSKQA
ncbi:MAG: rhomboid family intramembrane serine protease, partial [Spirochaetaceae bacterium]|nr:rhomboid family intramembrane serine protease [Spirochaetaceae bacterium]